MTLSKQVNGDATSGLVRLQAFAAAHPNVKHVVLLLVDYCNNHRAKAVSLKRALQLAANGSGTSSAGPILFGTTRYDQLLPFVFEHFEESQWLPDWSTLRVMARDETQAVALVSIDSQRSKVEQDDPMATDPRVILRRLEASARDEYQAEFKVGWEIEFTFYPSKEADAPINAVPSFFAAEGMRHPSFKAVQEIVEHLEANGVDVWAYHTESGPNTNGKMEISLSPQSPLQSADDFAYATEVIKDIAAKHGYFATLHPFALETGGQTNGQHVHMSVSNPDIAPSCLAGILDRFHEACAFFLGGYDSYSESRGKMYGNGYIFKGTDKAISARMISKDHWEFRMNDAMCSPHLQLAALLATALEGIKSGTKLDPIDYTSKEVNAMTQEKRDEAGIRQMPRSLKDSIAALEKNKEWWGERMGKLCVEDYIMNRKEEVKHSAGMTVKARRMAVFNNI